MIAPEFLRMRVLARTLQPGSANVGQDTSVLSQKFLTFQRAARGLWQWRGPPGMARPIAKGRNAATGPVPRAIRKKDQRSL